MTKLAGKVAVVTGASKGIGAGIAKALAADLQRHGISDGDQRAGLNLAVSKGWLQMGADGAVQLTDAGFDLNFNQ